MIDRIYRNGFLRDLGAAEDVIEQLRTGNGRMTISLNLPPNSRGELEGYVQEFQGGLDSTTFQFPVVPTFRDGDREVTYRGYQSGGSNSNLLEPTSNLSPRWVYRDPTLPVVQDPKSYNLQDLAAIEKRDLGHVRNIQEAYDMALSDVQRQYGKARQPFELPSPVVTRLMVGVPVGLEYTTCFVPGFLPPNQGNTAERSEEGWIGYLLFRGELTPSAVTTPIRSGGLCTFPLYKKDGREAFIAASRPLPTPRLTSSDFLIAEHELDRIAVILFPGNFAYSLSTRRHSYRERESLGEGATKRFASDIGRAELASGIEGWGTDRFGSTRNLFDVSPDYNKPPIIFTARFATVSRGII